MGHWTINVHFSSDSSYVTMEGLTVIFHGSEHVADSVKIIPEKCSSKCVRGCAAKGDKFCDSCKYHRMISDLHCVKSCPGSDLKNGTDVASNSCSINGYCMICKKKPLYLSKLLITMLVAISILLIVLLVSLLLWSKLCRASEYISI